MTYSIKWADKAAQDYLALIEFISASNPPNAQLVKDCIDATVQSMKDFPAGRVGRVEGTYERPVPKTRYIISFTQPAPQELYILRLIHWSRQWTANSWPE